MLQLRFRSPARRFVFAAIAYSLGVFGVLKLTWVEIHAVLPFTQWQGRVAEGAIGAPALPIDVTLACSGVDAFALCAGAILAYPASWRQRLGGTAIGFALILTLNSIRIGTLGRAAASPRLFETLHVYVWPAVLILAIAGYVFGWMQRVNPHPLVTADRDREVVPPGVPFALMAWAVVFVILFVAASPLYLHSTTVLAAAALIARGAATALSAFGIAAAAHGNLLWTSKGVFEVTQECIATPLVPLYFAAVMTYCTQWRRRVLAVVAAAPLFAGLGIARLLVMALPAALVGSPLFLIHAFYQLLLAVLVVFGAAVWQRRATAWRVAAIGCLCGAALAYLLGPAYAAVPALFAIDIPFNDAQGAMASLPSFQTGLYVALSIATMTVFDWRALITGLGRLVAVQAAAFGVLVAVSRHSDLTPHIRDVRAWAIAAPLAIIVIGLVAHDPRD